MLISTYMISKYMVDTSFSRCLDKEFCIFIYRRNTILNLTNVHLKLSYNIRWKFGTKHGSENYFIQIKKVISFRCIPHKTRLLIGFFIHHLLGVQNGFKFKCCDFITDTVFKRMHRNKHAFKVCNSSHVLIKFFLLQKSKWQNRPSLSFVLLFIQNF